MAQNKAEKKRIRHVVSCTILFLDSFLCPLKIEKVKVIKHINERKGQMNRKGRGFYTV